jgi:hypothetical protein
MSLNGALTEGVATTRQANRFRYCGFGQRKARHQGVILFKEIFNDWLFFEQNHPYFIFFKKK